MTTISLNYFNPLSNKNKKEKTSIDNDRCLQKDPDEIVHLVHHKCLRDFLHCNQENYMPIKYLQSSFY